MDSSGFSSPRSDYFPAGLRVLVVDDDPTWLKILERMLKKCNYEVTICNLGQEALNLLRERKDGFDLVISDVNMPDMDGFKLLELVGLEMDLPVIIMSVDGETSRVMKGVQHGACDYLLKPVRMKELRNIWQHVFRKRINELRDIEGNESIEELYMMRNGTTTNEKSSDDGYDQISGKKRKDEDRVNAADSSSSSKKSRLVWTVELHQKFVKAVNQIGLDKVGPKKVRDLMGVSWITRENVASHLQKYRLYLSRLHKEDDIKASGDDVFVQNSVPQNESSKGASGNVKTIHQPMPMAELKNALYGDVIDPPNSNNTTSDISFGHYSVAKPEEAKIPNQYRWGPQVTFDWVPPPRPSMIKEADTQIQVKNMGALFSLEAQSQQIPYHPMWETRNHNLNQYMFDYVERNTVQGTGSFLGSRLWDDEFNSFSSGLGNQEESIRCNNQDELGPGPHVPPKLFDSIILDCEYPFDPVAEYPMMDQGVHIL